MAPRYRGRLTALLTTTALLVSSCAAGGGTDSTSPPTIAEPPVTTSTTSLATTTTETPGTTTEAPATTTTTTSTSSTTLPANPGPQPTPDAVVSVPEGEGPFPAIVLVHGGGWVAGDPSAMAELAGYLTENGYLTVNTSYQLAGRDPGFPGAVDDVACAVSFAATHPDSDGSVGVVGHSAGAHLSAVVGLTGDSYGGDCPFDGPRLPERIVGLAGPYDVTRLGLVMLPFFGGGPDVEPEAWEAGNPINLTGENPELTALLMHGDTDAIVQPSFSVEFHEALTASDVDATLEIVEGASHMGLRDPDIVGELIVTWLER